MLKTLLKKQMMELGAFLYQSGKEGKRRSKTSTVMYALLMVYSIVMVGWIFWLAADALCEPLVSADLGWLYFAMFGISGTIVGVIGSIFTTYSGLYRAKDNELLLAMPVPPSKLLFSRMTVIYLMSLIFTAVTTLPAAMVYFRTTGSAASLAAGLPVAAMIALIALSLSCILGWLIGLVSVRIKGRGKNAIIIILTLAFLGGYYYGYSKISTYLQLLIAGGQQIAGTIKKVLYPMYQMGKASEGSFLSLLIFALMSAGFFAIIYTLVSRSFMKIALTKTAQPKSRYKGKNMKKASVMKALLRKESMRFTGSSVYMLNCGLGTVMLIVTGAAVVIKSESLLALAQLAEGMLPAGTSALPLIGAAVVGFIASMNDISAPSVSLEGSSIWVVQSAPVSSWQILKSKILFHCIVSVPPALICSACIISVIKPVAADGILMMLFSAAVVFLYAVMGLAANLKMPNLKWSNEIVVIKQSFSVLISLFGGWAVIIVLSVIYFVLGNIVRPVVYLACATAAIFAAAAGITLWIRKKGTEIFRFL